jgi:hypothetical protein
MPGMVSPIDSHPAKQQIIDGILAGKPYAELARLAGCSKMSISRYVHNVVKPAVRYMSYKRKKQKEIAKPVTGTDEVVKGVTHSQAKAALPIADVMARLHRRNKRREEWLDAAEQAEDFRALGTFDSNGLREIELECRLNGLLDNQQQISNTIISLVCDTITIQAQPGSTPEDDGAIDITSIRTED